MTLLFGRQRRAGDAPGVSAQHVIPGRPVDRAVGAAVVTNDSALRSSAVWACLRLRANLISTFPVDVFRSVNGVQVEVPRPQVLRQPGGPEWPVWHWLYATQFDLDRAGNAFGLVKARDGMGRPSLIEPLALSDVRVTVREGRTVYRVRHKEVDAADVWHERQYPVPGLPVGLSPIAYAAWSIGEYLSIQDFALQWFGSGGVPRAHLRNTTQKVNPNEAQVIKERFRATVEGGGLFVTGHDWEYDMIQAEQTGLEWLEAKRYGIGDVARFFDVPGDMIDAAVSTGSITYANITQRNLQFLITSLGPAIVRREGSLSGLTAEPRFVKLNTDALLRMDPETRAKTFREQIESRTLAPSEARALDNRAPFTDAQLAEFDRLFPQRATAAPAAPTAGGSG